MKKNFFTSLVGPATFSLCLVATSASALSITYHTPTAGSGVTATEITTDLSYYGVADASGSEILSKSVDYLAPRKDGDDGVSGAAVGYDLATHGNSQWQGLGQSSDFDDGVTWSVDNGATWDNTSALTAGKEVTFRFNFWQANNGAHIYDQILASFDFGQDDTFDVHDDTLLYAKIFTSDRYASGVLKDKTLQNARFIEFEYTMTIDANMWGDTWLRVRSTCWHGDDAYPNFLPSGDASQGETEDYLLTINPVPEPTTMLLFGAGLIGLAGVARRKKK